MVFSYHNKKGAAEKRLPSTGEGKVCEVRDARSYHGKDGMVLSKTSLNSADLIRTLSVTCESGEVSRRIASEWVIACLERIGGFIPLFFDCGL